MGAGAYVIRRATAEDAKEVYALWRSLVKHELGTGANYPEPLSDEEGFDAWEPEF